MTFTLQDLNERIKHRANADEESSYTALLLSRGIAHCAQKLGEEAVETVIAAMENDKTATTKEAADVLYHLLVLLHASGVDLDEVMDELAQRTAQSGIEEKASR
jgi:phosphoribosyl-ATP pyrophosphohydrolase